MLLRWIKRRGGGIVTFWDWRCFCQRSHRITGATDYRRLQFQSAHQISLQLQQFAVLIVVASGIKGGGEVVAEHFICGN